MNDKNPPQTPGFFDNRLSKKVTQLAPSGIRVFFDIVSQRNDVISLGVGEPDFVTPQIIVDEAVKSLRGGYTYYTSNQGIPSLRRSITSFLENKYGLSYDPDKELLITVGVSEGIDLALRAILNQGDGVIFGTPSYVSYFPLVEIIGGKTQTVDTSQNGEFLLRPEDIQNACDSSSKVLFMNYPANPTGRSYNKEQLTQIAQVAEKQDLLVISDEIYGDLTYDFDHTPMPTLPGMQKRTILLGGFSKTYAMTGWRVGFAAGPREWISAMLKIHQYCMLCAPTISQYAAEAAIRLAQKEAGQMKEEYLRRREFVVTEFNRIGLKVKKPEGAFFVFPDISPTGLTSHEFATKLLEKESIAAIPGTAFGPLGEGYLRCSYATSMDNLKTALARIERFIHA